MSLLTARLEQPDAATAHLRSLLPRLAAVCALVVVVVVLVASAGPLSDPDVWWHVRTGRLILSTSGIPHTDPYSFTAPANSWVPTAWLSDVLFAVVWQAGSWDAIRLLRVLLAVAAVVALWIVARRGRGATPAAAIAVSLTLLALSPFLRERPQVISFLFVAWLAVQMEPLLAGGFPRLRIWIPLCWLWSNLHGMWVLMPAALVLLGVASWVEDRSRVSQAARCVAGALGCWAVTLLTPVGPRLAIWPFVVRDVARPISEWQPTLPLGPPGLPLTVILAVIVLSWARQSGPVRPTQLLMVATTGLFGFLASRNVAPAVILLLPPLARAVDALSTGSGWQQAISTRGSRALLAALVPLLVAAVGFRLATTPTFDTHLPMRIVADLSGRVHEVRVLNNYDVGGLLTGLASPPVRVAIDGRTDIWSASYVASYLNDLAGTGDWRSRVDQLRPDAAVLPVGSEVARGLQHERGWTVTLRDAGWLLLEPPAASHRPAPH